MSYACGAAGREGVTCSTIKTVMIFPTLHRIYRLVSHLLLVTVGLDDHIDNTYKTPPRGQTQSRLTSLQAQVSSCSYMLDVSHMYMFRFCFKLLSKRINQLHIR